GGGGGFACWAAWVGPPGVAEGEHNPSMEAHRSAQKRRDLFSLKELCQISARNALRANAWARRVIRCSSTRDRAAGADPDVQPPVHRPSDGNRSGRGARGPFVNPRVLHGPQHAATVLLPGSARPG